MIVVQCNIKDITQYQKFFKKKEKLIHTKKQIILYFSVVCLLNVAFFLNLNPFCIIGQQ